MTRVWSPQQEEIFAWGRDGHGNLVVRARAGTGKTTTIIEMIEHAPEENILLCAFNKRIAEELSARLKNPHAEAKTLHSVGFGLVRKQWRVQVDEDRGKRLAAQVWAQERGGKLEDAPDAPIAWVAKLVSLAKSGGREVLDIAYLTDLAYSFNVVPEGAWQRDLTVEDLADMAVATCALAYERDGTIDYDDMIWLPVVREWGRPTYDLVVVDEAQDMNGSQLSLALSVASGRICVVGDDRQAIYGWRGADSNAIDRLKKALDAQELPLNVTYRCPKKVVEQAKALCPDFEAYKDNPDGEVLTLPEEQMIAQVEPNDFVLSRLNAPLAALWLKLVRSGKPARVEGRDLAKSLVTLIRGQHTESVADLLIALKQRLDREVLKLMRTKLASAQSRVDFLRDQMQMVEALSEGLVTSQELVSRVEQMFGIAGAPRACVVLSTVHRAKGLEAPTVYVLTETLYCYGKRRESQEEKNIHYVAVTRAKSTLVLVTAPSLPAPPPLPEPVVSNPSEDQACPQSQGESHGEDQAAAQRQRDVARAAGHALAGQGSVSSDLRSGASEPPAGDHS